VEAFFHLDDGRTPSGDSLSSPKADDGRARSVSPGLNHRSGITGSPSGSYTAKARTRGRSPLTGQTRFSGTGSPQESPSSPGRIRQALGTVTGSPSSLLRYTRSLRRVPNPPPLMKEPTSPLSAYSVRGAAAMRKVIIRIYLVKACWVWGSRTLRSHCRPSLCLLGLRSLGSLVPI
jgi:hypothetical protein